MRPSKKHIQRKWQIGRAMVKELRELRIEKALHVKVAAILAMEKARRTKNPEDIKDAIEIAGVDIMRIKQDIRDAILEQDHNSEKELKKELAITRQALQQLFELQRKGKKAK